MASKDNVIPFPKVNKHLSLWDRFKRIKETYRKLYKIMKHLQKLEKR